MTAPPPQRSHPLTLTDLDPLSKREFIHNVWITISGTILRRKRLDFLSFAGEACDFESAIERLDDLPPTHTAM
jgi:hypothetical protein